jgi:TonB family protein
MQEAVSAILLGRSREVDGLSRMVTISVIVHVVLVALVYVLPPGWFLSEPADRVVPITISMGGVPGQDTGGMTSIAARAVQEEAAPKTAAVRTPAAKTPEMVAPTPEVKPKPTPKPVEKPVDKSSTKKASTGEKVTTGPARVDTPNAAQVPFGGLSSGGGGTGGVRVDGNFCCPEYIEQMKAAIYKNWDRRVGPIGKNEVKFTIRRDGYLANVAVEAASGNPLLDLESRRAVLATQRVPPLPDRYTSPTLTIYLTFEYTR